MARHFSGPRLRNARKSAGLTPEHLAISVGRSSYSIREYELGRVTPSVATLAAMADILGRTVDELLDEAAEEVADAA